MLRRIVRSLRTFLLVVGVLCVAYIPVSYRFAFVVATPRAAAVAFNGGLATQISSSATPATYLPEAELGFRSAPRPGDWSPWGIIDTGTLWLGISVEAEDFSVSAYRIPLWLLAAVCLAWPVTSFVVRRRRRGRGFEVEANADAAPPAIDNIAP
jgi:hypothetical protein